MLAWLGLPIPGLHRGGKVIRLFLPAKIGFLGYRMSEFVVDSRLHRFRKEDYQPWLAWYSVFMLVWTMFLLYAGGFTTSIDAGMAFLDWPLSNGSINPDGWLTDQDQFAEHSHRLLGMKIGILSIILVLWCQYRESRASVRALAWVILIMVVVQGVLGGLRVRFDALNLGIDHNTYAYFFRVAHGCLAQVFLCTLVAMAITQSRTWITRAGGWVKPASCSLRWWGVATCVLLGGQLLLGAIMRHGRFSLIIPYFPHTTSEGSWLPPQTNWETLLQYAHTRIGPLLITICLLVFLTKYHKAGNRSRLAQILALGAGGLLAVQISLGILTVIKLLNKHAATLHVICGAGLLAMTFALLYIAFHPSAREQAQHSGSCPITGKHSVAAMSRNL